MKKRLLAILLASACLLTACQSSSGGVKLDPQNPVSVEVWHYYNGPQKSAFDALVNEFNSTVGLEKGIVVEALNQGNVSELTQKIVESAEGKVGAEEIPQVFAAYADTAYAVDQLGLVASLDPYLTQEELDSYIDAYISEGRFDKEGSLKIFPIAKSTEIMIVNRTDWDKFAEATGAELDSLSTLEGLAETAEAYYNWTDGLTPEPDDGKAFFGRDAMANYFIVGCRQMGIHIFDVQDGQVMFHLDEAMMHKLWDLYYVPFLKGYFTAKGRFRSDDAKTGDLIALVGSTSGAAYFPDKVTVNDTESYPIELTVLPAPILADGEPVAVQQGAGMVVAKSTPEQELASVEFLKWFTDDQRNLEFSLLSGYLPVKKAANDRGLMEEAVRRNAAEMSVSLQATLPVASDVVNSHLLYTNKAFYNGTAARNVLEYSMSDLLTEDLAAIEALVAEGTPLREAQAQFLTEEHFQEWLQSLQTQLGATQS